MSVEDEIIELEQQRCQAIAEGNRELLADMMTADYLHVYGGGLSGGIDDWIDHVTDVPRFPEREEMRVRVYGDTAVLTGKLINRIRPPDDARPAEQIGNRTPVREDVVAFATQVLVREAGQWKFCSFQLTRCVD